MAKAKAAQKKAKANRTRRRARFRRYVSRVPTPAEEHWRIWTHDFDTAMHGLLRNEACSAMEPGVLVLRAEMIADAMKKTQDRRRPTGVRNRWG